MKKLLVLSFCLLVSLVIAGCCSSCPAKKGCDKDRSCTVRKNCNGTQCSQSRCPVAKCAAADCEKCCGANQCANCCDKGKCSKTQCGKSQCPVAKCAASDCGKCCGANQCAKCCDKGKCSKGKCDMKPQICPAKPKASMSLNWKLELSSLEGVKANAVKPRQDIVLGFDFAKRQCYGSSGVNRYFGPITVNPKEGKLSFGQLGSTMMMGPGMDYEQAYMKMLSTVDGCRLDNGQLVLTSKGKVVARYVPIDEIK